MKLLRLQKKVQKMLCPWTSRRVRPVTQTSLPHAWASVAIALFKACHRPWSFKPARGLGSAVIPLHHVCMDPGRKQI